MRRALGSFTIHTGVFERIPNLRIAVAVTTGDLDNATPRPAVEALWRGAWSDAAAAATYGNAQSHPRVKPWRDAFQRMGVSGKQFPSSVEALLRRALKVFFADEAEKADQAGGAADLGVAEHARQFFALLGKIHLRRWAGWLCGLSCISRLFRTRAHRVKLPHGLPKRRGGKQSSDRLPKPRSCPSCRLLPASRLKIDVQES